MRFTSFTLLSLAVLLSAHAEAQSRPEPKANWALANRYSQDFLRPFVFSTGLNANWINKTDTFWYTWKDANGVRYMIVDPMRKTKKPLFDSVELAAMLSESLKKPYDTTNLALSDVRFDEKYNHLVTFSVDGTKFLYDVNTKELKNLGKPAPAAPERDTFKNWSPDKKSYVYAMDHNLYLVQVEKTKDKDGKEIDKDGEPIQLTKDGEKDYSFGSRDSGREFQDFFGIQIGQGQGQGQGQRQNANEKRVRAGVSWSEDSKRFYVMRGDSRKVQELYLVNSLSEPRPKLLTYRYAMPGEPNVTQWELHAYDPEKKELKKLDVTKYKDQSLADLHFPLKEKSEILRFVRRDRLQRNMELCELNLASNELKVLLTESIENAFLERRNVRYVKPGGDFLWWSEKSGWGHLYLHSFDGKLKNAITKGPWRVENVIEVDEKKGDIWLEGVGRETDENPYYRHLYKAKLDGSSLALLDAGDADHSNEVSPKSRYIVTVSQRTDLAPVAELRAPDGKPIMALEKMDLSRLFEHGWKMPETFKVKAADGVTDIYGNMWKPFDFDPKKRYPIIANVYPGPQTESVSTNFSPLNGNQRLAQLGFIVIQIGNRGGNPSRSNAYHSYGYYNLRDYGLADKKTGIEQLAARYPWVDVNRVGIFGHSGGGFMTAAAMLLPPYNEFFKVGVSSAGNHDNNVYNANWSEQHHGLREVPVTSTGTQRGRPEEEPFQDGFNFDPLLQQQSSAAGTKFEIKVPTNHELAANLKGKLLLVHGDLDNNVHPAGTVKLANALIRANKRFDLMLMPGQQHGFGPMSNYFNAMTMEYFAEHLLGDYYRDNADMILPK